MTWKTIRQEWPPTGKKVLVFIDSTKKYKVADLVVTNNVLNWNIPGKNEADENDAWLPFEFYKQVVNYEKVYE